MNKMNKELENSTYENDTRIPCKYGENCYQKNAQHHEKYKHPPKVEVQVDQPLKKRKLNENENSDSEELVESTTETTETNEQKSDVDLTEKDFIKKYFLLDMPKDFYSFWTFCESLNKEDPLNALENVDLMLVGPFDVLANKFKNVHVKDDELFLRHWRFYFDPPEFQTVIKCHEQNGLHFGYYRDDPNEDPVFVCSGTLTDGRLNIVAENLFGCINTYLENYIKKKCTPFNKMKISKLRTQLQEWAKRENFHLAEKTDAMKNRNTKVITKPFHGIGIVVPYNKKTKLGYRPLIETNDNIKKILKNIVTSNEDGVRDSFFAKLQPIITMASIAADECDFGTSLELGLDLFTYGGDIFHNTILSLLIPAYNLLDRDVFATIIKAHLKDRKKEKNLSIINSNE